MMEKHASPSKGALFMSVILFIVCCFITQVSFALSIEEERKMGEEFLAEIRKEFRFVDDPFANRYINDLGQYLTEQIGTKNFPFRFYVVKDDNLNAFAGPGGHIFVFAGLIEATDAVDELAAVLCHEAGHVSARHLSERIEQNKKISIGTVAGLLAGALLGGKAGEAVMAGTVAAGIQTQLHFSREDESQADQLGFKYMAASRFDPAGMISVLNKIQRNDWYGTEKVPPYLLTHPAGPERMGNMDSMLSGYTAKPENKEVKEFRERFPYFKAVVLVRSLNPSDAERYFESELKEHPKSAWAHFGLGMVLKERFDDDLAGEHFKKAMEGDPGARTLLKSLVGSYVPGKNPQDTSDLFLLANSYQEHEQYEKAIAIYERLIVLEPGRDEAYYNLGMSYGRLDKLALAHYYFGIYFQRTGKRDKALFHFRKAEDLAGNDRALRDRIRKAMGELPRR